MPFYARLVLVILVVVTASEFFPSAVNALLILILLGMVLLNVQSFSTLINQITITK